MKIRFFFSILLFVSILHANTTEAQVFFNRASAGAAINTSAQEAGPVISADGKYLFFSREIDQALYYYCESTGPGTWGEPKEIELPGNQIRELLCIDRQGVVYFRGAPDNYTLNEGISTSTFSNGTWGPVTAVEFDEEPVWDYLCYLTISPDGKKMILAIGDGGEIGDLYLCKKRESGKWSKPLKICDAVNEPGRQETPFLASDNQTLYFASKGHDGKGDMDIFMSKRLDDTWLNWSTPSNLGSSVNTPAWDADLTIDPSGAYAYFLSWGDSQGQGDIFRCQILGVNKPLPLKQEFQLVDKETGEVLNAEVLTFGANDTLLKRKLQANNGKFLLDNELGQKQAFIINKAGYISQLDSVDFGNIDKDKASIKTIYLEATEVGKVIRMTKLLFEKSTSQLVKGSEQELERLKNTLKTNPALHIEISGHTDNVGSAHKNMQLSAQRAKVVFDYLVAQGISEKNLNYIGHGMNKPLADNNTEEGKSKNRRVEFKIIAK